MEEVEKRVEKPLEKLLLTSVLMEAGECLMYRQYFQISSKQKNRLGVFGCVYELLVE